MENPAPPPPPSDPTDLWDWENLFNFPLNPDDDLTWPQLTPPSVAQLTASAPSVTQLTVSDETETGSNSNTRVRKRDPRLICPNFIAGIVPCACPELDALAAAEEEAAEVQAGARKRVRKIAAEVKCQVGGCEVDIRELKGYHRRHRVCLSCAAAGSVLIDGEQKRYCQQCGKFHLLPDFDEGKKSCRRKLERHNKRRRRKPDSKNDNDKELENNDEQLDLIGNLTTETSNGTEIETLVSNNLDKENSTGSEQGNNGNISPVCTLPSLQNEQSISILSIEQEEKFDNHNTNNTNNNNSNVNNDNNNNGKAMDNSSMLYENKTAYSSSCPTGRISFKLYDWNPAEFPRRLRHQIFEWLSSMPVELEGYIRPGCTILTIFISMPQSMWDKLYKDATSLVKNLVNSPGSLLLGKGTFLVYLDNMIFQNLNGGSLMNIKMEVHSPKIHYVHPTFFEVGKPIEFIICGSFLNQPKFRSLVSFNGKYVKHKCNILEKRNNGDDYISNSNHEIIRIIISDTEPDIYGPGFIEVDNVSGLSNFVPVLFGTKRLCIELEKLQNEALNARSNIHSYEYLVSKQNQLSELLLDIAWLLQKDNNNNNKLSKVNIERLTHLLRFLVSKKLIKILEIVLISLDNLLAGDILSNLEKGKQDADLAHFLQLINHAKQISQNKTTYEIIPSLLTQGQEKDNNNNICSTSETEIEIGTESESVLLVPKETVLLHRERCRPKFEQTWSVRYPSGPTRARFAAVLMVGVLVCVTACIVLLHPHEPGPFAVSVRRYLYRGS